MARSLLVSRPRGKDDGFNLVELIVAMVIIGVVLLLLVGVQISAAVSVTEARKLQQATAFANEAVEQMRSIPWNTLNRGMYSDFLAEAGGDSLVSGGYLDAYPDDAANVPVPLKIATVGADQDPSSTNEALPLFDQDGSNKQVVEDPSGTGTEFTVKGYVYEVDPSGVPTDGIVGIAVVVEWQGRRGTARTAVWSEAYRGSGSGCSQDLDTQPFLAACQSFFDASSSSGSVLVGISAIDNPVDPTTATTQPLTYPTASDDYTLSMATASAGASLRSQQVTYVDSLAEFGGNSSDDGNPDSLATDRGYEVYTRTATDDATNPDGEASPPAVTFTQSLLLADDEKSVGPSEKRFRIRSDYLRSATQVASMTTSCLTGIPAGQPCARTSIANNNTSYDTGSGYLLLDIDGAVIRLSRRLNVEPGSTTVGNTDEAWVARLASVPGGSAIGCTSIVGAGCVAAGANKTNADLSIGVVFGSTWDGGAAPDGMVSIEAEPGYGDYYRDSVRVERGAQAGQMTMDPVVARNGRLNYWNGSSYTHIDFRENTSGVWETEPVTWTGTNYVVTGTTQVHVSPKVVAEAAPPDGKCEAAACTVSASAGSISIVSSYLIHSGTAEYILIVTTVVEGSSASASYKAPPSVS